MFARKACSGAPAERQAPGVRDHHRPWVRAVTGVLPGPTQIGAGLHQRRDETTKSVERSLSPRSRRWPAST